MSGNGRDVTLCLTHSACENGLLPPCTRDKALGCFEARQGIQFMTGLVFLNTLLGMFCCCCIRLMHVVVYSPQPHRRFRHLRRAR